MSLPDERAPALGLLSPRESGLLPLACHHRWHRRRRARSAHGNPRSAQKGKQQEHKYESEREQRKGGPRAASLSTRQSARFFQVRYFSANNGCPLREFSRTHSHIPHYLRPEHISIPFREPLTISEWLNADKNSQALEHGEGDDRVRA